MSGVVRPDGGLPRVVALNPTSRPDAHGTGRDVRLRELRRPHLCERRAERPVVLFVDYLRPLGDLPTCREVGAANDREHVEDVEQLQAVGRVPGK